MSILALKPFHLFRETSQIKTKVDLSAVLH
jgi:hypothetical protein